jgi:DNA-binding response OmpR family regulator
MNARPVLILDSDAEWCERICRFLAPHGIETFTAADVTSAAATISSTGKPAAVVMESSARGNGEAVSQLRRVSDLNGVPVGYLRKNAALDALLLMLGSSATPHHRAA